MNLASSPRVHAVPSYPEILSFAPCVVSPGATAILSLMCQSYFRGRKIHLFADDLSGLRLVIFVGSTVVCGGSASNGGLPAQLFGASIDPPDPLVLTCSRCGAPAAKDSERCTYCAAPFTWALSALPFLTRAIDLVLPTAAPGFTIALNATLSRLDGRGEERRRSVLVDAAIEGEAIAIGDWPR